MKQVFADTSYYLALLNAQDEAHAVALRLTSNLSGPIVTTAWELAELGNHLADVQNRQMFCALVEDLRRDNSVRLIPPTQELFDGAFELYSRRMDKAWSFVDCISFRVTEQEKLVHALSTDHHFRQAGFVPLLADQ